MMNRYEGGHYYQGYDNRPNFLYDDSWDVWYPLYDLQSPME